MAGIGGMCGCSGVPLPGGAMGGQPIGANNVPQVGALGAPGGPSTAPAAPAPAAPASGAPKPTVLGGSPSEVAQVEQMLGQASASPTARRLFADLQRTGLRIAIKDDALDPHFASNPNVAAYEHGGTVHLRRSHFADPSKRDLLFQSLIHESVHVADTLDRSRIAPAVAEVSQLWQGRTYGEREIHAEQRAIWESRAYAAELQISIELGRQGPRPAGGFGSTGISLGRLAQRIMSDPQGGYSLGTERTATQSLSDAVLGHALLS